MAIDPSTLDDDVSQDLTFSEEPPYQAQDVDAKPKSVNEIEPQYREPWHMASEVQAMKDRDAEGGEKPRKLGVTWQNLTVKGISSDATFNENVL